MRLSKILFISLFCAFMGPNVAGQANASLNIQTQNGGQVALGAVVDILVVVGNTGPTSSIGANKVRAQISIPTAIASPLPNAQQTGLPPGWSITVNNPATGTITICNGSDIIDVGEQRQIFIKVQGTAIGGPSTVNGTLLFSNGTSCTTPGTLTGDNIADNTSTTSIQVIPAPSCSLTGVSATAGTISCNGGSTTLTATSTGVSGPVEYSLNGGGFQSNNSFTVGAGTYTVTAREVNTPACAATATAITVTEPPVVLPPTLGTIAQPTCSTASGSVILSGLPSGSWTINPGAISGSTATTTISGLAAGTYSFTVTNAAGCVSAGSAEVVINTQPVTPTAPVIGTITQPTCAIATGSVELSGLPSGSWTINSGSVSGNTATTTINGLVQGTYSFTVTNTAGCTSPVSAQAVITSVAGTPSAPTVTVLQPTCTIATGTIIIASDITGLMFSLDGAAYGIYPAGGYIVSSGPHTLSAQNSGNCISPVTNILVNLQPSAPQIPIVAIVQPNCVFASGIITVTSPTVGLMFSLDNGTYLAYPANGYIVSPGLHSLTAKNTDGCISPVANATINSQPTTAPSVSALAGTVTCFGGSITLTVTASGGSSPYEYSLNGGASQLANTFIVSAGTYTITVRDANLCTATTGVVVTEPTAIVATVSESAASCNSGTSTLFVTASGGIAPLQYSLNGGVFQTGNSFIVGSGTYTVTVKDANLCTHTTLPITITQAAALVTSASAKRITHCGGTTEVTVTAVGGIAPYSSGVGTFTRGPGTWIFSVADSRGCIDTAEITIEAPGCMDLKVYPNPTSDFINIYHTTAQPGSVMQVFDLHGALLISKTVPQNAFQTSLDVRKLPAGNYAIVYWNGQEKKASLFEKIHL